MRSNYLLSKYQPNNFYPPEPSGGCSSAWNKKARTDLFRFIRTLREATTRQLNKKKKDAKWGNSSGGKKAKIGVRISWCFRGESSDKTDVTDVACKLEMMAQQPSRFLSRGKLCVMEGVYFLNDNKLFIWNCFCLWRKDRTKEQTKSVSGGNKARPGDLKQDLNQVWNKTTIKADWIK